MADKKISALTAASTPLAGTEVLPIVQGGATTKVTVTNLTAGRAVSALSYTANVVNSGSFQTAGAFSNGVDADLLFRIKTSLTDFGPSTPTPLTVSIGLSEVGRWTLDGNYVPSTAAKGVNFTANTPAAGMTSQLLNWYEEGTWTPSQGAGLTVVGAFSSAGRYTRVGRLVTLSGFVQGGTSVAVSAGNALTSNLPFTTAFNGVGTMIANNQSLGGQLVAAGTDIYTTGMTAVFAIYFTVTYSV